MNIEYILLLFTSISCFFKQKYFSIFLLVCSVITAYVYGTINGYGILAVIGLYAITSIYFQCHIAHKALKVILLFSILLIVILLSFHLLPGFKNALVIDKQIISPLSSPLSMYLNFDKTIAGIILFMNSEIYRNEKTLDLKSLMITCQLLFLCSGILMTVGLFSGYVKPDFKIPDILFLWCINNLFFVCFCEEVVFRGVIQNKIEQLSKNAYLSLGLASFIFGLAHFKGGIAYVLLASTAGAFYGLAYQKTRRILSAMLVHFGLNLIHFVFFTYPTAIKMAG